jgi:hypothetical protein
MPYVLNDNESHEERGIESNLESIIVLNKYLSCIAREITRSFP